MKKRNPKMSYKSIEGGKVSTCGEIVEGCEEEEERL